jgi:hypothetical protein
MNHAYLKIRKITLLNISENYKERKVIKPNHSLLAIPGTRARATSA